MSDSNNLVLDVWSQLKVLVETLEEDVHKNAVKGNLSAGVRVRKNLRNLRKLAAELAKVCQTADKTRKEERKTSQVD